MCNRGVRRFNTAARAPQRDSQLNRFAGSLWPRADLLSFRRADICFGHVFVSKIYPYGVLVGRGSARIDSFRTRTVLRGANSMALPQHSFCGTKWQISSRAERISGLLASLMFQRKRILRVEAGADTKALPSAPYVRECLKREKRYIRVSENPFRILVRSPAWSVTIECLLQFFVTLSWVFCPPPFSVPLVVTECGHRWLSYLPSLFLLPLPLVVAAWCHICVLPRV